MLYDEAMSGVTWSERQPGDWLASNGRWYSASKYPRGWNVLALPPAPGHGLAHRSLRTEPEPVSQSSGRSVRSQSTEASQSPGRVRTQRASTNVETAGRKVADATVTGVSNYKRRIDPAERSSSALPPPPRQPPPPGTDLTQMGQEQNSTSNDALGSLSTVFSTSAESYAGDLGRVLGKARRKIEEAINEATENT